MLGRSSGQMSMRVAVTIALLAASFGASARDSGVLVAARQAKCSAPTGEDYEGTDMSGVTPKCEAIFNACIDASQPCNVRKQKCAQFDKMDKDGSCYRKRRS